MFGRMLGRRKPRKGPNPKYWWIWAIAICALILLAQHTIVPLAEKNTAEREAQQAQEQITEVDQNNSGSEEIVLPEDATDETENLQ